MICRNTDHELLNADGTCASCGGSVPSVEQRESRALAIELALIAACATAVLYACILWRAP